MPKKKRLYILESKQGKYPWQYESTYSRQSDAWGDADFDNEEVKWRVIEYVKGRTFKKRSLDKR